MFGEDGQSALFEQLRLQYESDLRSYCRMLTGTPWDAEDLYQETMLKSLRANAAFLSHLAPRAFLFRVASNAWLDVCRKRKADVRLPVGHEALASETDTYSFDTEAALHRGS
ncbi:RNA polymerase sigma factor [Paenibacillus rhizovicinus]|uniref:RNA polymerase sigma factor n=1 Tax=Paenibacillus rhizovicinus TaxID=2704463 RepID=A0A6C0P024_9BACL|nr:RNA polymerase sigma factor [Paenibacillus rhizovicinus]QHW31721.1 RNA polymerase sigma factor [Paenibacillus rhizovicinus]